MNKPTLFNRNTHAIALSLLLLASPHTVFAADEAAPANPYSSTKTLVLENGNSIDIVIANSPVTPPEGMITAKTSAESPAFKTGDVKISGVPAFKWSYGSSATAGAMIAGFYDRNGYPDMYTGPTDGGVMPLTNAVWGSSDVQTNGSECPLSASKKDLDGRVSRGHVDDYYVDIDDIGPDPYVAFGAEHTIGDCTGDYMKTSKWFPGSSSTLPVAEDINKDGAAIFIISGDGNPMTAGELETNGYNAYDAGYGLKLFFESKGETVLTMYNQYINPKKTYGFTYEQYKEEIDANRPVMLHLSGHIVVGIGYNDLSDEEIIFHDSWSYDEHTMIWGGLYNTVYKHDAVTIVLMEGGAAELTWYKDADGDGYSDGTIQTAHMRPTTNYFLASELTAISGDCDDTNSSLNPNTIWYQDDDSDGYGNPEVTLKQCEQPIGYVSTSKIDDDDADPKITTCFNWNLFFPAIMNAN